jgi:uroporphyrinogen decarboxylase
MAYTGVMDDVRCAVRLGQPSRVPCFPLGVSFDYNIAGITYGRWMSDPEAMTRVGVEAVRRFDYDLYLLHPDDLLEYEGTGIGIRFAEDQPPAVERYLTLDRSALTSIKIPDARSMAKGRSGAYLEGIRCLKRELGSSVVLVGRVAAPFSTLSLIFGIEATMVLLLEDPSLFRELEAFFLEYNSVFAHMVLEAGADALWLGDCMATSYFISPRQYREFAAPFAAELSVRIRARGGLVFYHGGEISLPHLEIAADLPFDAINIGYGVEFGLVKEAIGGRMCLMGNLDTLKVLRSMEAEGVARETATVVKAGKKGGGYIFCTGEGITHDTPAMNVKAMVGAVREYGRY